MLKKNTNFKILLIVFGSKRDVKLQSGSFSNRNDVNSLVLGTKENINLRRADLTFYTLMNYFRKLLEFFWV